MYEKKNSNSNVFLTKPHDILDMENEKVSVLPLAS